MNEHPITVSPDITLQELVDEYVYRHGFALYPVVREQNNQLVGCITVQHVKQVPRDQWPHHVVGEMMNDCGEENTVHPETDAVHVLGQMRRTGQSRMMVVQNNTLLGIITLKDLLKFLALKVELEDSRSQPPPIRWAGGSSGE